MGQGSRMLGLLQLAALITLAKGFRLQSEPIYADRPQQAAHLKKAAGGCTAYTVLCLHIWGFSVTR